MRFRVHPRDVPPAIAARRMGLSEADFMCALPALLERGFPQADPVTGNFDLAAIDRYCDARNPALFGLAKNAAVTDETVVMKRIAEMSGG